MVHNSLSLKVYQSPTEAPVYRKPEYHSALIVEAVVVKQGTTQGNATIDLVFLDEQGRKHVALITARLLKMVLDTNSQLN